MTGGSPGARPVVRTVGHGTLAADDIVRLLHEAGITHLVDVRSHPGSRRHPHVGREVMARWLDEAGIASTWLPGLGGRRRGREGSPHLALRHPAFRAYADHMASDEFRHGVEVLLVTAREAQVAVMCAESVWWRCHRRLLADHLVAVEGVVVQHLFHDGRLAEHHVTPEARVEPGPPARLVYDRGTTPTLALDA